MDYKETHISFLYDDLIKDYGDEQGHWEKARPAVISILSMEITKRIIKYNLV